ncbi:MAG: hypothetical protein ABSG63_19775, partial [Spirochaetia bacterium]
AMCIDEEVYKRVRPGKIREILATYYEPAAKKTAAKKPAAQKPVRAAKPSAARKGVKIHG